MRSGQSIAGPCEKNITTIGSDELVSTFAWNICLVNFNLMIMKERLKKIVYKNKEILIIDYSNCKEPGMIELATAAKELILKENKKVLVLNILNDKTYVTPKFIRHH